MSFELNSKYDNIIIHAETIEQEAISQIYGIANSPIGENAHIRIMPDAHAGKGCVIGTTMKYTDKICPNVVGVDIGCGVLAVKIPEKEIDLQKLDEVIHKYIPAGMSVHSVAKFMDFQGATLPELYCWEHLENHERLYKSLGTLGGGWA